MNCLHVKVKATLEQLETLYIPAAVAEILVSDRLFPVEETVTSATTGRPIYVISHEEFRQSLGSTRLSLPERFVEPVGFLAKS